MADTNEKKKKKKVHRKGAPKNFSLYKAWEKDKAGKSNAAARDKVKPVSFPASSSYLTTSNRFTRRSWSIMMPCRAPYSLG